MSARRRIAASWPVWLVVVTGLLMTGLLASAARVAYDDNEDRLLEERIQEGALVLDAFIPQLETPLSELARLIDAVGSVDAEPVRAVAESMLSERGFASITMGGVPGEVVTVGGPPKADDVEALVADAVASATDGPANGPVPGAADDLRLIDLLDGASPRVGLLLVGPAPTPTAPSTPIVYAEQLIPPDRSSPVEPEDAFSGLHHAVYLGDAQSPSNLIFTSTMDLPLEGRTSATDIPVGDSQLLLVMAPSGSLSGRLLANLPWLVLLGGVVSTGVGSLLVRGLHRRQRDAQALSEEVEELYSREHANAHTLQQSLLPSALPTVAGVEIAARYVAAARGVEVGGDWYDVVDLDGRRLVLVVGDAAGHGVQAATVMAAVRYGANAIASQGRPPAELLEQVNRLDGVRGEFVTILCSVIDPQERSIVVARAGHPPPLVIGDGEPYYLTGPIGPPVGFLGKAEYRTGPPATMPAGATVLLFTDGLYERPDEDVDTGLDRLLHSAASFDGPLEGLLDHLYAELVGAESRDDVAMLAVRFGP